MARRIIVSILACLLTGVLTVAQAPTGTAAPAGALQAYYDDPPQCVVVLADMHHHREANYLGRTVEIAEGTLHCCKLQNSPTCLKPICSDAA